MDKDMIADALKSAEGALANLAIYAAEGDWNMVVTCAGHVADEMEKISAEVAK